MTSLASAGTAVTAWPAEAPPVAARPRGRTNIDHRVVERIAGRAITELPDAGISELHRAKAAVDGRLATLRLSVSLLYPAPIRQVTRRLRHQVAARVEELTGLEVRHVDVHVVRLVQPTHRREVR